MDPKTHNLCSRVTSQTYEKKSRTTVLLKHGKFYLNHNMFDKDVPIYTAFKAMGMECDQEITQMIGTSPEILQALSLSLQECSSENVLSQQIAYENIAAKLKPPKHGDTNKKPW